MNKRAAFRRIVLPELISRSVVEEVISKCIVEHSERARTYRLMESAHLAEIDECCAKALDRVRSELREVGRRKP